MESIEVLGEVGRLKTSEILEHYVGSNGGCDNLEDELLEGLDSYLDDIDDQLTISRMVSGSVIKGVVKAVEKMAEEKIAEKESELASMREKMRFLESGGDKNKGIGEVSNARDDLNSLLEVSLEDMIRFRKLGVEISERINEVSNARNELDSLLKSLPGSDSGQLVSQRSISGQLLSQGSISGQLLSQGSISGQLLSQGSISGQLVSQGSISGQLVSQGSISRQLVSQGSIDMDNFNRKLLSSDVSTSSSFWVENGHSKGDMPDTWEVAQLGHLSRDGLVDHFNSIISKMRRDHETQVQKMTEDYFSLKREFLKERSSSFQHRKDKDWETMRKSIPKVILKLDNIIAENEKLSELSKDPDTFTKLKIRVNDLLLDNRQLREILADKEKEIKSLALQVSDASEKMLLQHSLAEENIKKLTCVLESAVEDADIETCQIHEVYECVFRGLTLNDESKDNKKCEIDDSDMESLILQGIYEVIFTEAIKDAKVIVDEMNRNHMLECDSRISLEKKALEREKELKLLIEENDRLKREVSLVVATLKGEEKKSLELSTTLSEKLNQLELVSYELNNVKGHMDLLESSLAKREDELDQFKCKFSEALDQNEVGKRDMKKMEQKLNFMSEELRVANEERNALYAIAQKKQGDVMLEANKIEERRQLQSAIGLILGLSREFSAFESRVTENIKQKNLRLKEFSSLLQSLSKKTNLLRKTSSVYKQKLERKCADLETAETEVDLLGDQVDTLVNLLEKIYIGLDHYSPILRHYPGIMEILKLVRRELSGESGKVK